MFKVEVDKSKVTEDVLSLCNVVSIKNPYKINFTKKFSGLGGGANRTIQIPPKTLQDTSKLVEN